MVAQLRDDFENWIGSIDLTSTVPRLTLRPNARFLSFNYTAVLQKVYGIFEANVLHIHGSAANSDRLIFGHGDEITEEPELDENGDSNRHMYSDAESSAKAPLYAFKKQTASIITENADWFHRLIGVRTVVVLGLSLNDIDIPYIRQVHASAHEACWIVSCYQPTDEEHHRSQLTKIGVQASRITCCPIGDCDGHI